jgi:UDP-glucose 4-epimerase
MKILVTGGAGYVGSVVAEELVKDGYCVVILDNLEQGHREAVPRGAEFVAADICDPLVLEELFRHHRFEAVMHMAAETVVEFSVTDPWRFFRNNIIGGLNLLEAMRKHQVNRLVFSSSAAVYGEPRYTPMAEDHPEAPINAYGETKLMFERVLSWYGRAYGLRHISLRYFNAAGASARLGEDHRPETHLIPNVLRAGLNGAPAVSIFGTDYPTKDGTCIRDYVHVLDIAQAHVLALKKLDSLIPDPCTPTPRDWGLGGRAYNLGNGEGYSVLEVIETARKVTGVNIPVKASGRRPGDPAVLVASSHLAKTELGWTPRFSDLESIIESAWRWMKEHPYGYRS